MRDRLLTKAEKHAIRFKRCGKCKRKPPYPDGSWTQKHRRIPGSKGGRYTKRNTVPRCPDCHAKEPKHRRGGIIMLSQAQRHAAGVKRAKAFTREHQQAAGRKAGAATKLRHRRYGFTAKEQAHFHARAVAGGKAVGGANLRKAWKNQRSKMVAACRRTARKNWQKRRRNSSGQFA